MFLFSIYTGCNKSSTETISLNGTWKFGISHPDKFYQNKVDFYSWNNIQVPGECMMQGFPIMHDSSYIYKKRIQIPSSFKGKEIILQFDGVYSYAKVWVNEIQVGEHVGGFTSWQCNLTGIVQPGKDAIITVEMKDLKNEVSYASGYAKHQIGGILRDVWLKALPKEHIAELNVETNLDRYYKDAQLLVSGKINSGIEGAIRFKLFSSDGKPVKLENPELKLNPKDIIYKDSFKIENPAKWDPEHPNLYTIEAELMINGNCVHQVSYNIGFRKIEIRDNELIVNGNPVKFRGACHHDIHPTLGRVNTPGYDLKDVLACKEANVNFIRTSHYPPTKNFLDLCDQYGIWVECEAPACFVRTYRSSDYKNVKHDGPEFHDLMLQQIREMVQFNRNHPCVVLWSIGNESMYDPNFQASYDWIKKEDPSRPVIFSYPGTVPDSVKAYDVLSIHYPSYTGSLDHQFNIHTEKFAAGNIPVLSDEWAHIACYDKAVLADDPNMRNFWGKSLDIMWANSFESTGSLGGAIWGMIDETFMIPDSVKGFRQWWGKSDTVTSYPEFKDICVGYGEWGFMDTWRRKKPEFWNVKKAYSPVRLNCDSVEIINSTLIVPVFNRYDFTNLNELEFVYQQDTIKRMIKGPGILPHQRGKLIIPGIKKDIPVVIKIMNKGMLTDEYRLLDKIQTNIPDFISGHMTISENNSSFTINNAKNRYTFNYKTGLIENIIVNGKTVIKSGPWLVLTVNGKNVRFFFNAPDHLANNWKLTRISKQIVNGLAKVTIEGTYNSIVASYLLTFDGQGLLKTNYTLLNLPSDEVTELGVRYEIPPTYDSLYWKRKPYWTIYPEGHIGAGEDRIALCNPNQLNYRAEPKQNWENDVEDFYYLGREADIYKSRLTNNARAMKENIGQYTLIEKNNRVTVYGNFEIACRLMVDKDNTWWFSILNQWDYVNLSWGNYMNNIKLTKEFHGESLIKFE